MLRRRSDEPTPEPEEQAPAAPGAKGRPTPKQRAAQRRPVKAPQTRKESYAWQKAQQQKARAAASGAPRKYESAKDYRDAVRRGEEDALPRRDRGPARKLARDWVDSRRMLSNYMLWLLLLMVMSTLLNLAILNLIVFALFITILSEWFITGRRIKALAQERYGPVSQGAFSLGFYAGSRAYLPRKWRLPMPQVELGDEI